MARPVSSIASEISSVWTNVNYGDPPVVYAEVFTDLFNECVRMMGGNDGEA